MVVFSVSGPTGAAGALEYGKDVKANIDAVSKTAVKPKALPSCMKKGAQRGSRDDRYPWCSDVVVAYGEADSIPWMEVLNTDGRKGKRKADNKLRANLPDKRTCVLAQLIAWIKAKELAAMFDCYCVFKWPVLWLEDFVVLGGPHIELGKDLTEDFVMPSKLEREEAERLL